MGVCKRWKEKFFQECRRLGFTDLQIFVSILKSTLPFITIMFIDINLRDNFICVVLPAIFTCISIFISRRNVGVNRFRNLK